MNYDQHVKRFEYEKLFDKEPLTDDDLYIVDQQIKYHKVHRAEVHDRKWPDANRGR